MNGVILIGIQGSGKSSFYRERFFDTHVRINLDMLKTRHRERILFDACLAARQAFVVDNTNVTKAERSRYVPAARAAGFTVVGYFFEPDLKAALRRNKQRKAVIPVQGVSAALKRLEAPDLAEGFDALYSVRLCDGAFHTFPLGRP